MLGSHKLSVWPAEPNFIICCPPLLFRFKGSLIKKIIYSGHWTPIFWCKTLHSSPTPPSSTHASLAWSMPIDTHHNMLIFIFVPYQGIFQAFFREHILTLPGCSCRSLLLHWGSARWRQAWLCLWVWRSQCGAGGRVLRSSSHQRTFQGHVLCPFAPSILGRTSFIWWYFLLSFGALKNSKTSRAGWGKMVKVKGKWKLSFPSSFVRCPCGVGWNKTS